MRKLFKNTLIVTAALMVPLLSSCQKEELETIVDNPIIIGASATNTKAMLDADAFKQDGNRAIIYDFVDGNYYFSDLIGPDVNGSPLANSMKPQGVWPFVNGPHQWTPGEHKFFGWLVNDSNGTENDTNDDLTPASLFGNTFTTTINGKNYSVSAFKTNTQILTIPETDMSNSAVKQYDFLYSNIVTSKPKNEPVGLDFSHLFAAYFFSFSNNSPEPLELESVKLNVKSKASATLNYSGMSPVIDIVYPSTQPEIEKVYNSSVGAGKTIDVLITGNELSSTSDISSDKYRLIWPQDLTGATIEIAFTAKVSIPYYRYNSKGGPYNVYSAEEVAGGSYTWKGTYYEYAGKGKGTHNVLFQHDARGVYEEVIPEPTAQKITRTISLASVTKDGKWQGGNKYNYNLSFSNDVVDMTVVVMRWDGGHGGDIIFE